jgi:L-aspartate oxidase
MLELDVDHCWLDATGLDHFVERFPTIASALDEVGLDPSRDWLPIAPAAHYLCGGILTDLDGATTLPGLWAAGEVACSGVHGANRLASNSLLEGMVFGARVVEAVERGVDGAQPTGAMRSVLAVEGGSPIGGRAVVSQMTPPALAIGAPFAAADDIALARQQLQRAMTAGAGVLRDSASLSRTAAVVDLAVGVACSSSGAAAWELANLAAVASALLTAAHERTESRGAHTREDFAAPSPEFATRLVIGGEVRPAPTTAGRL